MEPRYARCPWCETDRPLKKDGTFYKHYAYARWSMDRRPCEGIGRRSDGKDFKFDPPAQPMR